MSDSERLTKQQLEKLVYEYGGQSVQMPTGGTFCVIAMSKSM